MHRFFHRVGGLAKVQLARLRGQPLTVEYVTDPPSPQLALDLFKDEWSSHLPPPLGDLQAGWLPLFEDPRIEWAAEALGGVAGASILELGPLEGGHSWMLEQRGAASITAIEANRRAYLKCLVMKETMGMTRTRFLLGDFMAYLRAAPEARFDVGIASGVLYHMHDPVELLARLARACDRLFLWTHYYDEAHVRGRPKVDARFGAAFERTVEGFRHTLHPHWYQAARFKRSFCGSGEITPRWMERDAILEALGRFGYDHVQTGLEEPGHIHGPAFAIAATDRHRRTPTTTDNKD
jgi:SAM-dependent methyltransferase